MKTLSVIFTLAFLCVPSISHGDDYFSVADPKTKSTVDCSFKNRRVEPGTLKGNPVRFIAFINSINSLKKRMERSGKKPTLQKQLKTLQVEYSRLLKLCKSNLPAALPSPTPADGNVPSTPVPTATPNKSSTPTPTPTSSGCSLGCYDSSRNTPCFNIPSPVKGNETRGFQLWGGSCAGCHSESSRRNRLFSQISQALRTVPEMLPYSNDYSTQDIADLVAYLNRFNAKQCRSDWP